MHRRLIEFLEERQILYYKQFGFQKDLSTNYVILNLLESISCNVTMHYTNYSLNRQNLLFFCFNLLKSIIYLLSRFKFDINKKEIYQYTEKLSREW